MSVALKKEQLEELIIKENEVSNFDNNQLFSIQLDACEFGPIFVNDLKNHIEQNDLYKENILVKNYTGDNWQQLVSHPSFQRRRPQVIDSTMEGSSYFILVDGQKTGPFSVEKINELIDQKTLLYTDQVCLQGESEWVKIHSIKAFDRRKLTNNQLPEHISNESILYGKEDEGKVLVLAKEKNEKEEALAGLAWTHAPKKEAIGSGPVILEEEKSEEKSNTLLISILMLTLGASIFAYFIFGTNDTKTASRSATDVKQNFKAPVAKREVKPFKAKKLRPVKVQKAKKIAPKKTRTISRGVKPFKESKVFKDFEKENKQLLDNAFSDSDQDLIEYDDGSSPVEQDPVRSKVSKDTLDPLYQAEDISGIESDNEGLESELNEEDLEGEIFDGEEEIQ